MDQQDSRTATIGEKRVRDEEHDMEITFVSFNERSDPSQKRRRIEDDTHYFTEDNSEEVLSTPEAVASENDLSENDPFLNDPDSQLQADMARVRPGEKATDTEIRHHAEAICTQHATESGKLRNGHVVMLSIRKDGNDPNMQRTSKALVAYAAKELYNDLLAISILLSTNGKWYSPADRSIGPAPQLLLAYRNKDAVNAAVSIAHERKITIAGTLVTLVAIHVHQDEAKYKAQRAKGAREAYDIFIGMRLAHLKTQGGSWEQLWEQLFELVKDRIANAGRKPYYYEGQRSSNVLRGTQAHAAGAPPDAALGPDPPVSKIQTANEQVGQNGSTSSSAMQEADVNCLALRSRPQSVNGDVQDQKTFDSSEGVDMSSRLQQASSHDPGNHPISSALGHEKGVPAVSNSNEDTMARLKHLSADAQELQARYWGITDAEAPIRCPICSGEGHWTDTCPSRTCKHCGARDAHFANACPTFRKCPKCHERGHTVIDCTSKLARSAADGFKCDICGGAHLEDNCSFVWRTFKPDDLPIVQQVDTMDIWCYECGGAYHWGDDCIMRPKDKVSFSGVFSASFVNQFLRNSAVHQKPVYSRGATLEPPPDGMSIRGKARRRNEQEDEEPSDSKDFYGKKFIPEPLSKRKMKFNAAKKHSVAPPPTSNFGYHHTTQPPIGSVGNYHAVPPPTANLGNHHVGTSYQNTAARRPSPSYDPRPAAAKRQNLESSRDRVEPRDGQDPSPYGNGRQGGSYKSGPPHKRPGGFDGAADGRPTSGGKARRAPRWSKREKAAHKAAG